MLGRGLHARTHTHTHIHTHGVKIDCAVMHKRAHTACEMYRTHTGARTHTHVCTCLRACLQMPCAYLAVPERPVLPDVCHVPGVALALGCPLTAAVSTL